MPGWSGYLTDDYYQRRNALDKQHYWRDTKAAEDIFPPRNIVSLDLNKVPSKHLSGSYIDLISTERSMPSNGPAPGSLNDLHNRLEQLESNMHIPKPYTQHDEVIKVAQEKSTRVAHLVWSLAIVAALFIICVSVAVGTSANSYFQLLAEQERTKQVELEMSSPSLNKKGT